MGWLKNKLFNRPIDQMSDMAVAREWNLRLSRLPSEMGGDIVDTMNRSASLAEELERRGYDTDKIMKAFTEKEVSGKPVRLEDCK